VFLLSTAGCTLNHDRNPQQFAQYRRALVAALVDRCRLQGQIEVDVDRDRLTIVRLDPEAEYERVDCFLAGLKPHGFDLGFVGNEAPN
jgi:hypothetical protein